MKILKVSTLIVAVAQFMSCNTVKSLEGGVTEQEAINGIKEVLSVGSQYGGEVLGKNGAFSKETLMSAMFPKELQDVASTLKTLGLSNEIDHFTTTLTKAAGESATKSVPIFLSAISKMNVKNAFGILKNGNTGATDYLRATIGDTLRKAITPTMNNALDEYKLATEWHQLVAPAQLIVGDKLNLDLGNLLAGAVTSSMFSKIEEKEMDVRSKATARTSPLLQKVFEHNWTK